MAITFTDKGTKDPILTRKIYDLMLFAYNCGYEHGCKVDKTGYNEFQLGIVEMLNDYFSKND